MNILIWLYGVIFGPIIFYLLGPLDLVYGPSLIATDHSQSFLKIEPNVQNRTDTQVEV